VSAPDALGVAIVGCGNIARAYVRTLAPHEEIRLVGAYDREPERARTLAESFDGRVYASLDETLADDLVDVVVNLTIHHAHVEVVTRCLEAGRHVHSEKPLAMTAAEARGLVELADRRGVRLSCAPITYMGEAQQTAWRAVRTGRIGTVRLVNVEVDHGRIETWHPAPAPFYDVGIMFDVGVYPLTILTAIFGPVESVQAVGRTLLPDRVDLEGRPFHITTPDLWIATLDLPGGVVARMGANFYTTARDGHGHGIEFHGDEGSILLTDFERFDAPVRIAGYRQSYEPLPPVRTPFPGTNWGLGVTELAAALREGRPQRATGAHAAHVVDVIAAMEASMGGGGGPVPVRSSFAAPAPMPWAADDVGPPAGDGGP
jgi:predicted dehydrogenase